MRSRLAEVLEQAAAACAAVAPHDLPDAELLAGIEELLACRDRLDGVLAGWIQAADARAASVAERGRATRSWLVEDCRLSPVEASRRVRTGWALTSHPDTDHALQAGEISHEHARLITDCLRKLPNQWIADGERILLDAARTLDPTALGIAVRKLRITAGADEDAEAAEQRRYASRYASLASTFDGMLHLDAMLDPTAGAMLSSALAPLMSTTGPDDDRTTAQRRADALTAIAEHSLSCGWLPDQQGERPHITVTIPWQGLRDELADKLGLTATVNGIETSAAEARRLACDAAILPAVLGGDSELLDLGRTTRTWTTAQRRAAALRDQGCTFPGCRAPLQHCRLHHLTFWAHGGRSDLANSAYLCRFHHWLVHHSNWRIWRNYDGTIEVSRT
ncbi:MAG TPA: DUF222 domain-containing protein [Mycobacteriales bacterium]|nr:DUF222 domain-containing protein [Mycobacteriales bacterium]